MPKSTSVPVKKVQKVAKTSKPDEIVQVQKIVKTSNPDEIVQVLILGAGWTSTFLIPLLEAESIPYAATKRAGSETTIPFLFNPASTDATPYFRLPSASSVLITFPIKGIGGSHNLITLYNQTHPDIRANFIQLGSSSIWPEKTGFANRHTPPDGTIPRVMAEKELLSLGGAVLNLSGLWGGIRNPKNWIARVGSTKEALATKNSLHLVHGIDVSYAILALMRGFTPGERWLLTDLRVYDWWDLANAWGGGGEKATSSSGPQPKWALELMVERGVRSLPRSAELMGRGLDSTEFWTHFGLLPSRPLNF